MSMTGGQLGCSKWQHHHIHPLCMVSLLESLHMSENIHLQSCYAWLSFWKYNTATAVTDYKFNSKFWHVCTTRAAGSVYVPLVRFSHFVRYQEKRNTTSWIVFLIPRALRKTKNVSCFVFLTPHGMRKTSGATVVFRFFASPEMRNTKNGSWRISFSLLPVIWLFGGIDGSSYWRGYHVATVCHWRAWRCARWQLGRLF